MATQEMIDIAHLMRRAGFGATRDELEGLVARGYEQVVEELLDPDEYGIPPMDDRLLIRVQPALCGYGGNPKDACTHHMHCLINNPRPLEEKMALFWHTVFATGATKVSKAQEMVSQMNMFRKCGLGNYRDLLVELSKNPAMIYWLDNNENHKQQPNENWGRELLELFSMGQGNYTEEDVYECARAFTGWTIAPTPPSSGIGTFPWRFQYRPDDHDDEEKRFLGQKGRFNGEDVIDIIVRQPATVRFIARHLYNFFVADEVQVPGWLHTPPRDAVAVNIIADALVSSDYEMKYTLRMIFNSDFFKNSRFQRVKSPAEHVTSVCRLVGDFRYPRLGLDLLGYECSYMGQQPSDPPSVEGWHYGAEWLDSGALVKRVNFAVDAVSNIGYPGVQAIVSMVRAMGSLGPEAIVDACLDIMGPLEVQPSTRDELIDAARSDGELNWETEDLERESTNRVLGILTLIASTREYQMC